MRHPIPFSRRSFRGTWSSQFHTLSFILQSQRDSIIVFFSVMLLSSLSLASPPLAPPAKPTPSYTPKNYPTHAERTHFRESVHPSQVMPYYRRLAKETPYLHIERIGYADNGEPMELIVLSKHPEAHKKRRPPAQHAVLFVINGIHAGEVCGIDATQMLVRDLLEQMKDPKQLNHVTFVALPVFNLGGHARFGPYNRVNQKGPARMGFRANARGYNLNRDFTKADTANMRAFYKAFHRWKPHILLDNHTTNGADYQYSMTYLISDLPNVPPSIRQFVQQGLKPHIARRMRKDGYPICPYVMYKKGDELKSGILRGVPPPRFSTGYGELFNTITILNEAHMLKDFRTRVLATYKMMRNTLEYANLFAKKLHVMRAEAHRHTMQSKQYTLRWKRTEKSRIVHFASYAYSRPKGSISGGHWVRYHRNQPKVFAIPFFDHVVPSQTIQIPAAYHIPRAWTKIIQRLKENDIKMIRLQKPTTFLVEQALITEARWNPRPYEGRMILSKLSVEWKQRKVQAKAGDLLVSTKQPYAAYILQMLEPLAQDSFLRWGFFNTIFQQKEYFSPYLFEATAAKLLQNNPTLRQIYENRLRTDPSFAADPRKRLQFLYQSSPYYEDDHNVYPISRVHSHPLLNHSTTR